METKHTFNALKKKPNSVHTAISVFAALVGLASISLSVIGALKTGIGWDTDIDMYSSIQIRSLPSNLTLAQAYDAIISTSEHYGILVQVSGDWLTRLFGGSTPMEDGWLDTYIGPDWLVRFRSQAYISILMFVLGTTGLAFAIARVTSSRVSGLVLWAAILSAPTLSGMSYINFKDMPVASGLMLVMGGLSLAVHATHGRVQFLVISFLSLGMVFSIGVRAGSWPLTLAILLGTLTCVCIFSSESNRRQVLLAVSVQFLFGFIIASLLIHLLNPIARIDYLRWLFDSAVVFSRYPHPVETLTLGRLLPASEIPWWYFPMWVAAQSPLLFIGIIVIGAISTLVKLTTALKQQRLRFRQSYLAPFFSALGLTIAIPVTGSSLYDGVRQLSFGIAPLLVIVIIGYVRLLSATYKSPLPKLLLSAFLSVALAGNLVETYRWSPYSYAYLNRIAQPRESARLWETDYWGTSAREGVEKLKGLGMITVTARPTPRTSAAVGAIDERLISSRSAQEFGLYVFHTRKISELPPECKRAFVVERDGIELGIGGICPVTILEN